MHALSLIVVCAALAAAQPSETVGPPRGALVVIGGGHIGPEIAREFLQLAGGVTASFVIIPTADESENFGEAYIHRSFLYKAGARNITVLHTRDRSTADSKKFVKPLQRAQAVWIGGGRQWRLVDSYLNTRTHKELGALLDRGGVIGGTSAGATVLGSYLVRGARESNTIMVAPGYEEGFGFMKQVAVDQHLLKRARQNDLVPVIGARPALLGIGIDESTALIVEGNRARVIGDSLVAIYEAGSSFYFLHPGQIFDLLKRRVVVGE